MSILTGNSSGTNCEILVVSTTTVILLGRDFLQKLGIHPSEKLKGEKYMIKQINKYQQIALNMFENHPHLRTRLGRSKNHIAKSTFKQYFKPTQPKGRRVSLHLLDNVQKELKKLIEEKQIIKLVKCWDEYFISRVVITVAINNSIKIATDS